MVTTPITVATKKKHIQYPELNLKATNHFARNKPLSCAARLELAFGKKVVRNL